jgi:hypothetical protein
MCARPVGVIPADGAVAGIIDDGADQERQQKYGEQEHGEFLLRAKAHGRLAGRRDFGVSVTPL